MDRLCKNCNYVIYHRIIFSLPDSAASFRRRIHEHISLHISPLTDSFSLSPFCTFSLCKSSRTHGWPRRLLVLRPSSASCSGIRRRL